MTFIDLGDFKIRFDPKEVRINIDGEMIDVGAKREEDVLSEISDVGWIEPGLITIDEKKAKRKKAKTR